MPTKVTCAICNKSFEFINNTHLKQHNLTIHEYKLKFPEHPIKSDSLRKKCGDSTRGKTYEQIYGMRKALELKSLRIKDAKIQMNDPEQRYIRRLKCGAPEFYTPQRKKNMSDSITAEVIEKRKNTFHKNLELGNFKTKIFGRQSAQAIQYIKNYIIENNIDEKLCYFDKGGVTGSEYFTVIYNPITKKKKTAAYDLVITSDGKHDIQTIIEINGPWHYRLNDVLQDPFSPSCPLKTNKHTKLDSYNIDAMKINKALELSKEVFIFWLDKNELVKITEPIKLINQ